MISVEPSVGPAKTALAPKFLQALSLSAVVTTVTGEQRKAEISNTVATIAVSDRIALTFAAPPATADALLRHAATIQAETLATAFGAAEAPAGEATATSDFGDGDTTFAVARTAR